MSDKAKSTSKKENKSEKKKKPYRQPNLIEHGSLSKLTQTATSGSGMDFGGGKRA